MPARARCAYRSGRRFQATPLLDDLGNMFQFNMEFSEDFQAARSVEFSRTLNPALQKFERWLAAHASRIPLPAPATIER
jgi:hypothetical protein